MPDYGAIADRYANSYGIPPELFRALIAKESRWDPTAAGSSGEVGLTQLMPGTAAELGVNPYDIEQNIEGGARYLAQQFARFKDWSKALSAYNAGAENVGSAQGMAYAADVLQRSGITSASSPGIQPSPPTTSAIVGSSGQSPQSANSGNISNWWYIPAIIVILILVAFGLYGVVKG